MKTDRNLRTYGIAIIALVLGWLVYQYSHDIFYPSPAPNNLKRNQSGTTIVSKKPLRQRVVALSVDGLRSDAITKLGPSKLPNFFRLRKEGASTLNARPDSDVTLTLPNHSCMMTGRGVLGPKGHNYVLNKMPRKTLHQNKGIYLSSLFDVLHDNGYTTALVAAKKKFHLFAWSYNAKNGRQDRIGTDHGKNKIDYVRIHKKDGPTLSSFLEIWGKNPHFLFLHLKSPDAKGHKRSWMSPSYLQAVVRIDGYIGEVLKALEPSKANTTLLVTTDHGGIGYHHRNAKQIEVYRIPMFAWGAGVSKGADLYQLNKKHYRNPGTRHIGYDVATQPLRNCNIANMVTSLFQLPKVPGSTVGSRNDVKFQ